jgi:putative SOS response-associated peptidase YedK
MLFRMGPASLLLTRPFTFRYMVQLAASAKILVVAALCHPTDACTAMLTSKQHKKLAKAYTKPPPNLSPEEAQVWRTLARAHALLTRWARKREAGRPPAPAVEAGAEGKPQLMGQLS